MWEKKRMRLERPVACVGEKVGFFNGNPEGKRRIGRTRLEWLDNNAIDFK